MDQNRPGQGVAQGRFCHSHARMTDATFPTQVVDNARETGERPQELWERVKELKRELRNRVRCLSW